MGDLVNDIILRHERMRMDRSTLDSHLDQVRELFYPVAMPFTSSNTPGAKVHQAVLDSTPEVSAALLAAGLQALMCNPASQWFGLVTFDDRLMENEDVVGWLDHVVKRMLAVFNSPRSNFIPQQHEKLMDVACFGTGCMYIADRYGNFPLFSTRPLAECYFAESAEGRIDTVYRCFELTARQAVAEWGNAAGTKIVEAADDLKRQDNKFKFIHATYPRANARPGARHRRGLPFASCFVALDEKHLIDEGGFHEFPYAVPRWIKRAGEIYGRGPGMTALADARMLQRMMKVTIRGAEKIIDPPLMVADDGIMSPVRTGASALTTVRWDLFMGRQDPVKPLLTGGRPDLGEELMRGVRQRIENAFYLPLLQFARDPNMTATQVLQITEQVMQQLNPILGRMQVEDLGALIDRTFGVMLRAGFFEPPPAALAGQELRVEYVSPVAKQQRLGEVRAYAQLQEVFQLELAENPALRDNIDSDANYRHTADVLGVSRAIFRPRGVVAKMRQARQQEQAIASERAGALEEAQAAAHGAKAMASMRQALEPNSQVAGHA